MTKRVVVLDPGHGGTETVGGSSANRAVGPNGLLEKDVVFDIATRVKTALDPIADVRLTRNAGINLSLSDRARAARDNHASIFVSLHLNGSQSPETDNSAAFIARAAGARSRDLAQMLVDRIGRAAGIPSRSVQQLDLGVLLPARHAPETAACLLEMAFLSNPQQARKLEDSSYRQRWADALSDGVQAFLATPFGKSSALEEESLVSWQQAQPRVWEGQLQAAGEAYQGARQHSPATATFRCAPIPAAVVNASLIPVHSANPEADARAALTQAGVTSANLATFERRGGLTTIRPFAELFGASALAELLRRLRYTPAMLVNPPHGHDRDLNRNLGVRSTAEILAPRLLLAIPGHFRELARRATNPRDAHALENLGWLLMQSIRDSVRTATSKNWWIPPMPVFVTPFANPLPSLSQQTTRLITANLLIDTTLSLADYNVRFGAWNNGLAGAQWRAETGVDSSPAGAGQPFYPQLVTIPAAVNIAPEKARIDAVWQQRLHDTDAHFPPNSAESRDRLVKCNDALLTPLNLIQPVSLGGLEMTEKFPTLQPASSARRAGFISSLRVLTAIQPVFERLFRTFFELGWNDLIFQTAGAGCFRGTKIDNNPAAARNISNHGYAIAIDILNDENPQGAAQATVDPRVVALFEAFHFRWGRCFNRTDPMHFEYCGTGC